ncbi:universal stress protein [Klenkia terrae]|uniref:Universal stress protein n=1 Tax=Klenkia terrae TaxID=1052259 RepID=A0ABU8EB37_9ACTN|nr:universal stress protein [Klenkia terrae]
MNGPRVVVGVDGSRASRPVVAVAARAARDRGCGLLIVHVSPWAGAGVQGRDGHGAACALRSSTELALRTAAQDAAQDSAQDTAPVGGPLDVQWRLADGSTAPALLAAAAHTDLLVVGSRARNLAERVLLGSVTTALLESSPVPLLLVPTASRTVVIGPPGPVVLALDGRAESGPTVRLAFAEAARRRAELVAVHVWDAPSPASAWEHPDGPLSLTDARDDEVRLWGESLAGCREDFPDVVVRGVVRHGPVLPTLLGAATAAQLLVLGRRGGRRTPHRDTGSVLAHRADCPTLVLPLGGPG